MLFKIFRSYSLTYDILITFIFIFPIIINNKSFILNNSLNYTELIIATVISFLTFFSYKKISILFQKFNNILISLFLILNFYLFFATEKITLIHFIKLFLFSFFFYYIIDSYELENLYKRAFFLGLTSSALFLIDYNSAFIALFYILYNILTRKFSYKENLFFIITFFSLILLVDIILQFTTERSIFTLYKAHFIEIPTTNLTYFFLFCILIYNFLLTKISLKFSKAIQNKIYLTYFLFFCFLNFINIFLVSSTIILLQIILISIMTSLIFASNKYENIQKKIFLLIIATYIVLYLILITFLKA